MNYYIIKYCILKDDGQIDLNVFRENYSWFSDLKTALQYIESKKSGKVGFLVTLYNSKELILDEQLCRSTEEINTLIDAYELYWGEFTQNFNLNA